jgi:hypothetical protein
MSRKALKVIWWLLALFSLTLGVVADLSANGATSDPGLVFGVLKRPPSEVPDLTLPVQIITVGLVLWLSRVWSTEVGGPYWAARVPIPYFDETEIDPTQLGGKLFQGAVIVIFVIVPFVLLVLVGVKYLDASVYFNVKRGPTELVPFDTWGHFGTRTIYAAMHGRPGFFRAGTANGPQYYPPLTWIYASAIVLEALYLARVLWGIFRSRPAT